MEKAGTEIGEKEGRLMEVLHKMVMLWICTKLEFTDALKEESEKTKTARGEKERRLMEVCAQNGNAADIYT